MASCDFCQGCPKCDKYYQEQADRERKAPINQAINQILNLKPRTEKQKDAVETVIKMLKKVIS